MVETVYCDWEKLKLGCEKIAKQLNFEPGYLLAVGKDGLLPGSYLSDILQKPLAVVMVSSYKNQKQGDLISNKRISCASDIGGVGLIVDAIADTGKTMQTVKKLITTPTKTAVLYYKPQAVPKPDYFAYEIENDMWVEFFWRKERGD